MTARFASPPKVRVGKGAAERQVGPFEVAYASNPPPAVPRQVARPRLARPRLASPVASNGRPTVVVTRKGFTLMETILAVGLSAILLVLCGAAINLYSRVVADRRADVVNAQLARAILHRIAQDLRATYSTDQESAASASTGEDAASGQEGAEDDTGTGDTSTGGAASTDSSSATLDLTSSMVQATPGLYGNEYELQLDVWGRFPLPVKYDTLSATGLDPRSANLWSDPKVVTYYVRPSNPAELVGTPLERFDTRSMQERQVLIRRVQSRAEATFSATMADTSAAQLGEQLLSDQVAGLWFEYFDGLQWLTQWDTQVDAGLPMAVRITIAIVDADAIPTGNPAGPPASATAAPATMYQITVSLPLAEPPSTEEATL